MASDESIHPGPDLHFLHEQLTLAFTAYRAVKAGRYEEAEKHLLQLLDQMATARAKCICLKMTIPQPYLHKKSGRLYELVAIGLDATNERDGTPIAIYRRPNTAAWYARERSEFNENFEPLSDQDNVPNPQKG